MQAGKNILLRRNWTGFDSCKAIADNSQNFQIINKDKEAIPNDLNYVFRWGTTSNVPSGKIINKASAIHKVFDKRGFRKLLSDNGMAPRTWLDFGDLLDNWMPLTESLLGSSGKVIIRPKNHEAGNDLVVSDSLSGVYKACQKFGEYYISEYIQKDKEYRVFFVSGRAVAVIEKIPVDKNAVSWGCVTEGQFRYIPWSEWPIDVVKMALDSASLSGLDFGAVDIMYKDRPYILEINTAPHISYYYGKCYALAFDYIIENGPAMIPYKDGWKGMIHPAIFEGATI